MALYLKTIEHVNIVISRLNTSERNYFCVFFFATSLYVPSGLHTGTKTCGKSFLACCSVYFFSATHLDVSAEPPQITGISTHHTQRPTIQPTAQIFYYAAHTSITQQKMQGLADDEGGKKAEAQGETI